MLYPTIYTWCVLCCLGRSWEAAAPHMSLQGVHLPRVWLYIDNSLYFIHNIPCNSPGSIYALPCHSSQDGGYSGGFRGTISIFLGIIERGIHWQQYCYDLSCDDVLNNYQIGFRIMEKQLLYTQSSLLAFLILADSQHLSFFPHEKLMARKLWKWKIKYLLSNSTKEGKI